MCNINLTTEQSNVGAKRQYHVPNPAYFMHMVNWLNASISSLAPIETLKMPPYSVFSKKCRVFFHDKSKLLYAERSVVARMLHRWSGAHAKVFEGTVFLFWKLMLILWKFGWKNRSRFRQLMPFSSIHLWDSLAAILSFKFSGNHWLTFNPLHNLLYIAVF